MFHHPSDNKFTMFTKHSFFWIGLLSMFVLFVFLFRDDAKIPQREVVIKIDVRDRVNICLPEDEKIFKKSFFDF